MAEGNERREVVDDPLSRRKVPTETRLGVAPVRGPRLPNQSGVGSEEEKMLKISRAFGGAVSDFANKRADDAYLKGKLLAQQGASIDELGGNAHSEAGYQAFQIRSGMNSWFANATERTTNELAGMSPEDYRNTLAGEFKQITDGITDPRVRNMAVQLGDNMLPRLAALHIQTKNDFNRQQTIIGFKDLLKNNGQAAGDNTSSAFDVSNKDTPSKGKFPTAVPHTERDVDTLVRTMYGEAGGEGAEGLSAVAHVVINRTKDSRWGNSAHAVSLEPQQFSTWNQGPGGNDLPQTLPKNSATYKRLENIARAALSGKSQDPTGGATHYYSPRGMNALVKSGSQSNRIPNWLKDESARSGGTIQIGGHIFAGRSSGAAKPLGIDGEGSDDAPLSNSTRELIMKYQDLKPEDRVQAVTEAMVESLDDGNETLFADAGGYGLLQQLGAKPSQINAVRAAKRRLDTQRQNQYDGDLQKKTHDIIQRAGKDGDFEAAKTALEELAKEGEKSDQWLTSVVDKAASVATSAQEAENDPLNDIEVRQGLMNLYGQVRDGTVSSEFAQKMLNMRAKEWDMDPKDVQRQMARFEQAELAIKSERRNAARAAALKAQKRIDMEVKASRAVATNDVSSLSGEEKRIAVDQIKKQASETALANASEDPNETAFEILRLSQQKLASLGLVDEELKSNLRAGLSVPVDSKGALSEGALDAYETVMDLKRMPGIVTSGYLNKLIDPESRAFLETAEMLDAGNLNSEEALQKAWSQMNAVLSPEMRDSKLLGESAPIVTEAVNEYLDSIDSGAWSWLTGGTEGGPGSVFDEEIQRAKENPRLQSYVAGRTHVHLAANPNLPKEVAVRMAAQDLQANATHVGGNILFGSKGRSIKDDMGLQSFGGSDAVHMAVTHFMAEHGSHKDMWGDDFDSNAWDELSRSVRNWWGGSSGSAQYPERGGFLQNLKKEWRGVPEFYADYNPASGTIKLDLYMQNTAGERVLANRPKIINVKDIGEFYKKDYNPNNYKSPALPEGRGERGPFNK